MTEARVSSCRDDVFSNALRRYCRTLHAFIKFVRVSVFTVSIAAASYAEPRLVVSTVERSIAPGDPFGPPFFKATIKKSHFKVSSEAALMSSSSSRKISLTAPPLTSSKIADAVVRTSFQLTEMRLQMSLRRSLIFSTDNNSFKASSVVGFSDFTVEI